MVSGAHLNTAMSLATHVPATSFFHPMPFGASVLPEGGVRFRLFAPACAHVDLILFDHEQPMRMQRDAEGWHELTTRAAGAGSRYKFRLPDGLTVADPASRFQPEDVEGPSEVIDPGAYAWQDDRWQGLPWHELVFYEAHVGTWTPEGTYLAAIGKLEHLVNLGVNALELMCLASFPGEWGWSYDPVLFFAPESTYGRPEDLKALIDAAHARGIAVFLDVVYNHFGPVGNYIPRHFPQICSPRHETPWGKGLNFDSAGSSNVREFIVHNALYWIEEFHVDGLRLDATHTLIDTCSTHILDELRTRVAALPLTRKVHLVVEHEQNIAHKVGRAPDGGIPFYAAQWNYDIPRLLTAVFGDFCTPGTERETEYAALGVAQGFVVPRPDSDEPPRDYMAPPTSFISYIQTHDLVGNRIEGDRIASNAPAEVIRALVALYLLMPQIPLLFMGEEWNSATPFPFFADYRGKAAGEHMNELRREGFARMVPKPSQEQMDRAPDPQIRSTFEHAKLNWNDLREPAHAGWLTLYRDLLALRREKIVPRLARLHKYEGSHRVLGLGAWVCSWKLDDGACLHLAVNLCGRECEGVPQQPGELLWMEGGSPRAGVLAPWTVRFQLELPGADRKNV